MNNLAQSHRPLAKLLATGQITQYSSEPDDGYFEKGIVKSYTVLTTGAQSGNAIIQLIHLDANTGVSFDAASKEIRCTGAMGVFKTGGGETIVVTGSTSNNGTYTTATGSTADHVHTVAALTDESAGQPVVIKKQETITNGNNVVIDNNTGLMWARVSSTKMGIAGDGKLPWTGVPYDVFAFAAAANTTVLGGYSDWRIPNINELISLRDFSVYGVNTTVFPSFPAYLVQTATTSHANSANAWQEYWATSYSATNAKNGASPVVLVRG